MYCTLGHPTLRRKRACLRGLCAVRFTARTASCIPCGQGGSSGPTIPRVFTVLQVVPQLDAGGVERTTVEVAEALTACGAGALVASQGGRLEPELRAVGAQLSVLPLATKNPIEIRLNASRLAKLARAHAVGLIHARSRAPAWSALWAARQLGLPFVTTYHGVYNARSGLKRFYNSVMARGDLVIANSAFTASHVAREHGLDPARIITIPRGVDTGRFAPDLVDPAAVAGTRGRFGAGPATILLVLAARLTGWKGQKLAIEALSILSRSRGEDIRLVLAGDAQGRDAYVSELQTMAIAAGIAERVHLPGHVQDTPALLAAADIVLAPSTDPEAFGRSVAEAQAMGRPVVASAHGGHLETVRDGETGILVAPGSAQDLAEALRHLIEAGKPARDAMGEAARKRVHELFSKQALQRATLDVYRRLTGEPRCES
jgi:glycosyltransferase involved in cell wall biosynthesis